jgi:hypothetical protein
MKEAMSTQSNLTRGQQGTSGYNGLFAYAAATVPRSGTQFLAEGPAAQVPCQPNPSFEARRWQRHDLLLWAHRPHPVPGRRVDTQTARIPSRASVRSALLMRIHVRKVRNRIKLIHLGKQKPSINPDTSSTGRLVKYAG